MSDNKHSYYFHNEVIKTVETVKDLGVHFSSDFCFSTHVNAVTAKAQQILSFIARTFLSHSSKTILAAFNALVRPHLEYCSPVWATGVLGSTMKIEKVQRRATRLITGLKNVHYPDRLLKFNLLNMENRLLARDLCLVYSTLTSANPYCFFFPARSTITRGHQFKLHKLFARKTVRKNSFSHRVIDAWNKLPSAIVSASTLKLFKRLLTNHLLTNAKNTQS